MLSKCSLLLFCTLLLQSLDVGQEGNVLSIFCMFAQMEEVTIKMTLTLIFHVRWPKRRQIKTTERAFKNRAWDFQFLAFQIRFAPMKGTP